jgi:hypothetical protein
MANKREILKPKPTEWPLVNATETSGSTDLRPDAESSAWYGVWVSSGEGEGNWMRDYQGWLLHYPAQAIAQAHADAYNAECHQIAGARKAIAKPF